MTENHRVAIKSIRLTMPIFPVALTLAFIIILPFFGVNQILKVQVVSEHPPYQSHNQNGCDTDYRHADEESQEC